MLRRLKIDRLGALLTLVGVMALTLLPFVVVKANRIVPGDPYPLMQVLPAHTALLCVATLLAAAIAALSMVNARLRLAAALLAIVAVAWALAVTGNLLTPAGNKVVRIAPGAGFWLLLCTLGLLATDAINRLRPGPALRVALLFLSIAVIGAAFAQGTFDNLSVMREYAVNAERFVSEVRQHLLLTLGSLAAAIMVGIPAGIACHRIPRLRSAALAMLNVVQTVPAIALFGILMAPLSALAAAVPIAAALGIRGIGTAPAAIALFLYSLLPIVANTVAGLRRVSNAAVDAAHGMGMTAGQVLRSVELPLALPVMFTGIRIALVQNIGLVTIAALIGAGGLGAFVFQGIGQTAIDLVLLGAIPTVALAFSAAVLLDALVEVMERPK